MKETNTNTLPISVVIPVYGSEHVLPELVSQLSEVLMEVVGLDAFEIIFVCDLSPDNSWLVIESLAADYPFVRGILLRKNAGQHNALMAGFSKARGEVVITMDDDLQHSPKDIPSLLNKLEQGADIVFAKFKNRQHATWKVLGSKLNSVVAGYLMQKPKDLYLSPFRAIKAEVVAEILKYQGPYVYVDGLLLSYTRNVDSVEVEHHDRYRGEGGYSFVKSVSLWLKMATSFSLVPLRVTSFIGIVISLLGFLLALVFIIQKFTIDMMPIGWSSLIVTILIVGGFQLLALGVIGEYLGRVLLTINAHPQYVVAKSIGFRDQDE